MDSVFTDLSRFVPMQQALDSSARAQLDLTKQNLEGAGKSMAGNLDPKNSARLKQACTEFEALFIKQMLDSMRKTINKQDDMIKPGIADNIFQDMLYDEYSRKMAKTGDFGIADMLYKQFTQKVIQPTG
jgi:peptidoglycan hydrolase FlgJ